MKTNISSHAILLTLLAALTAPIQLPAQQHHHYKVIEIGTFGGPNFFAGFSGAQTRILNNRGTLTGGLENSVADPLCFNFPECVEIHAFQWHEERLTDLGTLTGGANSQGYWINDTGVIVGLSQNGETDPAMLGFPVPIGDQAFHAAVWNQGKITDLGTFGGYLSLAQAINNRGEVVGLAQNNVPDTVPSILNAIAGGGIGPGFFLDTQQHKSKRQKSRYFLQHRIPRRPAFSHSISEVIARAW